MPAAEGAMAATYEEAQETPFRSPRFEPFRALRAVSRLIADKEDTAQVFEIMRALSGRAIPKGYARLLRTPGGGRLAYRARELQPLLDDREALRALPEGAVGRAYLAFMEAQALSAEGLAEESRKGIDATIDAEHPMAWYARRLRDVHDIWHVLTGYGRDALGETCLVAFSYAQTKSAGFALLACVGAREVGRALKGRPVAQAVWQGFRHGGAAAWLPGEDYEALLAAPLEAARVRLRIARPTFYCSIPAAERERVGVRA
jgi:ubiquinone biosynthesis protein COQ4